MGITWTDEQKKVIHSRTGNLLVSAAAGSGKTAVLVERILEMVTGTDADGNRISEGMDIDEVLVVTFTNAAAAQMKEKIADKLTKMAEAFPENQHIVKQLSLLQRADIMTIDGFCRSIVKEYFHTIGIDSSFDIADKAEMDLIKNDILDEVLEEQYQEATESFLGLVNCFSRKESDSAIRELVYQIYRVASGYPKPEKWIQEALQALAVSSREELQELKWYRDFLTLFHNTVDAAIAQAEYCQAVAMEPDGPAGYLDIILSDLDLLYQLQKADDIDEIYNRSEKLKSLKRIAKCNPEKQQAVRAHLKMYHESIKSLLAVVRPSEEILAECAMMAGPLSALLELTLAYMNRLRQEKKNRNLYEFRDISEFAYDILCAGEDENGHVVPSAAGISVSERYREILIDEYQDSNFLQEDILNCVSGYGCGKKNMFMVGDIKQSIYQFRMARPDLFLQKYNTYTDVTLGEKEAEEKRILLSRNFRSAKKVIDTINAVFEPLMTKMLGGIEYDDAARLKAGRMGDENSGYPSEILIVKNDCGDVETRIPDEWQQLSNTEAEAHMVADEIYEIVEGARPVYIPDSDAGDGAVRRASYKDIAILMRSVKKSAKAYEEAFAERGIPLFVESESGYFDAMEISTLLDMLAVVDNSHLDYELAAVLRSPLANVSEKEMAEIVGIYDRDFKDDEKQLARTASFYQKVRYYEKHAEYHPSEELQNFLSMLDKLKENKKYMSISEMITFILEETGYYWFVGAMKSGKRRQANIDMLIQKADVYEDSSFKGLFNFLRYMERLKTNDIDFAEAAVFDDDEDSVRMMTMHKSKGLEFPIVFVSGLGNRFSNLDAKSQVVVSADSYVSGYAVDLKQRAKKKTFARSAMLMSMNVEKLAEEIRILYVALSRAKEKLYMTAAVKNPEKGQPVFDYSYFAGGQIGGQEDGQTDGPADEQIDEHADEQAGRADVNGKRQKLPYTFLTSAGCFMDWIAMALSTHIIPESVVVRKEMYASWMVGKLLAENAVQGNQSGLNENVRVEDQTAQKENAVPENQSGLKENTESDKKEQIDVEEQYKKYQALLDNSYPYRTVHEVKNKMSVTEIKRLSNRGEENPGAELFAAPKFEAEKERQIPLLKSRMAEEPVKGNEMGTVIHKIMELIDFTKGTTEEINEQIASFFEKGFLPERYREHVRHDKIYNMVNSPLGKRMAEAQKKRNLFREQQFYVGMRPEEISERYKDSQDMVIVQGVIDAYFLEENRIVLLDYKTDNVDTMETLRERYHVQLDLYAKTLERLTGTQIKEKVIYAFHFDDAISL